MANIRKRFGATLALDGVSFAVDPGEVHALVGQNGAGKSTLMKILAGALAPDAGTITLDGTPYRPRSPIHARRQGVAMIYQELSLAPHLSVAENVLLGVEPRRFGLLHWRAMRQRAKDALAQLGHADLDVRAPVATLSPAAQQIVEIARALAIGCRVLVLDEPTSSLASRDVDALFALIRRLKSQNKSIIYISHFLEEVNAIADRFTVLRDGRTVGTGHTAGTPPHAIVQLMVGRSVEDLYPRSTRTPGAVVLTLDNLSGTRRPHHASLQLRRGEVLGIAGLIGAGRTELLRAVFGLDPVRTGTVRIANLTASRHAAPAQRWRQGLGFLSEDRKSEGLALEMSVADNLTLSDLKPFGPFGLLFPFRQNTAAAAWSAALDIKTPAVTVPVSSLSGGNQQKVALARLLHHDADILLLDEPTRGIDVASKANIYHLIDALATGRPLSPGAPARQPKAVLIVSSYFPELLGICDRIAVMTRGRLSEPQPAAAWTEHTLLLAATETTTQPETTP